MKAAARQVFMKIRPTIRRGVKVEVLPTSNYLLLIEYSFANARAFVTVFSSFGTRWAGSHDINESKEMLRSSFFFAGPSLYKKPRPCEPMSETNERGDLRGAVSCALCCFTPLHRKLLKKTSLFLEADSSGQRNAQWCEVRCRSDLVTCFCELF